MAAALPRSSQQNLTLQEGDSYSAGGAGVRDPDVEMAELLLSFLGRRGLIILLNSELREG